MTKYAHIFFDLDHTLWDFDKNSEEVLTHLYDQYKLHTLQLFTAAEFIKRFHIVNRRLWNLYNLGQTTKESIRVSRFPAILQELACPQQYVPAAIGEDYIKLCPLRTNVMPYAHDVLDYLSQKYQMHIITNGFDDVQTTKLESAGIRNYFKEIITSEMSGFKKPEKGMFRFALDRINASPAECVMIGDNAEADIRGARNASIDAIFYNPFRLPGSVGDAEQIFCLSELKNLL